MRGNCIALAAAALWVAMSGAAWAQTTLPTPICTTTVAGKCKPDGTTITVGSDGTIAAAAGTGTLTGPITATGGVTAIASKTGTGTKFVVDTSPTLVTPALGAATATSLVSSGLITANGGVALTGITTNDALCYDGTKISDCNVTPISVFTGTGTTGVLSVAPSFTGTPLFPVGSVGSPSLAFTGDATTGIARIASGDLSVISSGAEAARFGPVGASLNYWQITANNTPTLLPGGSGATIGGILTAKGVGNVDLMHSSGGSYLLRGLGVTSSVNYLTVSPATAGNAPVLASAGSDSAPGITITPKSTGAVTINNVVNMPGLGSSSAATTGTVCWTTSSGLLNVDTTTTCLLSNEQYKDISGGVANARDIIMGLKPIVYKWKPGTPRTDSDPGEHVGLGAFATGYVDERLIARDDSGNPRAWRQDAVVATLVGAAQEQERSILHLWLACLALGLLQLGTWGFLWARPRR